MRNLKKKRGITLVALVVTIVILIILATISVGTLWGERGIIKQAQEAKEMHENGENEEEKSLSNLMDEYNRVKEEIENNNVTTGVPDITPTTPAGTQVKKPSSWISEKVIAIADGKGSPVPLPNGYYYVGGNIDTGLVISDKQGDTMDASGVNMGNQFVWIPVKNESDLERSLFNSNGQAVTGLSTSYKEPYESGYEGEVNEYNTMKTQVLKYGGFFIGRFEAGINSIDLRTGETASQEVVVKKGVAPYNYVPWGNAMNDAGEVEGKSGAVYLAKNKYTHPDSVTSTLCYGSQWDAMCRYIGDGQRTVGTKEAIELTGSASADVSKNIYDLAGNGYEWTMETSSRSVPRSRIMRGGSTGASAAIAIRIEKQPDDSSVYNCFRCSLYVQ